jgi:ABC-2 type transport system ATP-binding protein
MEAVIETSGLTKKYRKVLAVDDLTFSVGRGQIFGFLGPNGSGKTTTIGMLLGIISPTAGSFSLLGASNPRDLHHARMRVGATLEYPNFYPYLSGWDNLKLVANVKRKGNAEITASLEAVGLWDRRKSQFKTYSLGMKQRLALAATMLGDPELILLDEPANGLDPEGMREIREIILRLADMGKTIFLSSHLLWEVERTCTHVAIIKKGRIMQQASMADVTSGSVMVGLRASNLAALADGIADYPHLLNRRVEDGELIAELENDDLASLNRFLAGRGLYLSHLALRRKTLEDAFMEVTGEDDEGAEPAHHMTELVGEGVA